MPTCPAAVATRGPSAARAARSRRSQNDPMHTRSVALWRNTSRTVGASASSALMSMLIRVSGNSSNRSREQRDRLGAPDPGLAHGVVGQRGDGPSAVGHPVEHGVVERDDLAVAGRVHVGLEVAVAHRRRPGGTPRGCSPGRRSARSRRRPGARARPGSARRGRGSRSARTSGHRQPHPDRGVGRHGSVVGQRPRGDEHLAGGQRHRVGPEVGHHEQGALAVAGGVAQGDDGVGRQRRPRSGCRARAGACAGGRAVRGTARASSPRRPPAGRPRGRRRRRAGAATGCRPGRTRCSARP